MTRPGLCLVALFVVVGAWSGAACAQGDAAPAAPASAEAVIGGDADPTVALHVTANTGGRLLKLWGLRRARLERGDVEGAAEILGRIITLRRNRGVARLDAVALSLLREAYEAAATGKEDVASDRLAAAARVAPGLPPIDAARARVAVTLKPWAVHRWLQHQIRGLLASFADFQYRVLLLADVVLLSLLILATLGIGFAVAQIIRYGLNVYYDLGAAFPGVMRIGLLAALGLLVLLPFFFGFGPLVILFPLAVVLWPYQLKRERALSLLFVIALGVTPWGLRVGDRLTEAGTGVTQALHAVSVNPRDDQALEQVAALVASTPTDWHAKAVLGLAFKRRGQLGRALPLLKEAAAAAPAGRAAGTVHNNYANALFAAGHTQAAIAAYEQAGRLMPGAAQPLFNLHRLYRRSGDAKKARTVVADAARLDITAVSAWNEDDDLSLNRFVVDMPLPAGLLTRRALSHVLGPTPLATRAWVALAGPVPELAAPLGAAATLLAFGLLSILRRRLRLTWPCARTGRPVTVYLAHGYPERPLSEEYVAIFMHGRPVDRRIRFELEQQAGRHAALRRWGTRLAGLVPGFVELVRGRPLRGAVTLAFAIGLGVLIVLPDGLLMEPVSLPSSGVQRWALGGTLGLLWLASVVRAFRWPEEVA